MKFVIQRVNNADVTVDNKIVGSIGKGFLILFGACETDTADMLPKFVDKIVKLRIFADENGKTNLSLDITSAIGWYLRWEYRECG